MKDLFVFEYFAFLIFFCKKYIPPLEFSFGHLQSPKWPSRVAVLASTHRLSPLVATSTSDIVEYLSQYDPGCCMGCKTLPLTFEHQILYIFIIRRIKFY